MTSMIAIPSYRFGMGYCSWFFYSGSMKSISGGFWALPPLQSFPSSSGNSIYMPVVQDPVIKITKQTMLMQAQSQRHFVFKGREKIEHFIKDKQLHTSALKFDDGNHIFPGGSQPNRILWSSANNSSHLLAKRDAR